MCVNASDGQRPRCAMDRSASAYADGPVHYVLVDATLRSPKRIASDTDLANRRVADVKKVERHQPSVRFSEWADRWLESLERKPSTVGSYRSTVAHAKKTFGAKSVDALGADDIAHFNQI